MQNFALQFVISQSQGAKLLKLTPTLGGSPSERRPREPVSSISLQFRIQLIPLSLSAKGC